MSVLNKHKNASLIFAIVAIFLVIGFNLYMYVIGPSLQANSTPPATPAAEDGTDGVNETVVQQANAANRDFSWLPIIISVMALAIVAGASFAGFIWLDQQRQKRDQRRRTDLQTLAQALTAYKQANGHYPISATYQPEYYTGINLSNDWHYYGLPTDDQMRQFLPTWPISDPSISYTSHDQTNQYIYYPRNNGQDFDLYAHLESSEGQSANYNQQDGLLQAWGQYNFKISSQALPVVTADPQLLAVNPQPHNQAPSLNNQPADSEAKLQTTNNAQQLEPPTPSQPVATATVQLAPTTPQQNTPAPELSHPSNSQANSTPLSQGQSLPTTLMDTSLQPQAIVTATQADQQETVAEQHEMSQINQLLQDVDSSFLTAQAPSQSAPPASIVAEVATPSTAQAAEATTPVQQSTAPATAPEVASVDVSATQPTIDMTATSQQPPSSEPAASTPTAQSSNISTLRQLDRFSQAIAIQSQNAGSASPAVDPAPPSPPSSNDLPTSTPQTLPVQSQH